MRWVTLFVVLVALQALSCERPASREIRSHGIVVRRLVTADQLGGATFATAGDFLLEGDRLRVLVGGLSRSEELRGAILDLSGRGMPLDDGIAFFRPAIYSGSEWFDVVVERITPIDRGGRPSLEIEGWARIGDHRVVVVQEYTIARVSSALSVFTRLSLQEGELSGVRLGGFIGLGGAAPFVPGFGMLADQVWHEANWLGREGIQMSTVFGFREGDLRARAIYEQHGRELLLTRAEVASAQLDLRSNDARLVRSNFVVTRGGLADAVRRLGWTRGQPFREITVRSPYSPEGTTVIAKTLDGRAMIRGRPDRRGQVLLPLPPLADAPRLRLVAVAYGHAPSDELVVDETTREATLLLPQGSLVWVRVSDLSGAAMPARVRVRGIFGTASPDLGPVHRADGAADTVVTADGDALISVPVGQYRVSVSRGPEWSMTEQEIEVTETFQPRVDAYLEHEVDPGDWLAADFHLHAAPSPDSQVSLHDRLATLVAEDIRFAVPTDHNHVTDYAAARDELHLRHIGTVAGIEVTTWNPDFGHFNAYPVPLVADSFGNGAPVFEGLTPETLFTALRGFGEDTVIQVNHPRLEPGIGYFDRMSLDPNTGAAHDHYRADFDVLEVWNGYDLSRPAHFERNFLEWLVLLRRGHRYVAVGNSDSHHVHYHWAGYPRTYVHVPGGDPAAAPVEVVRRLRNGHAFVTSGPFLEVSVDERIPGQSVTVPAGEIPVRVRVQAPSWMDVNRIEIFVHGELVRDVSITATEGPRFGPHGAVEPGLPPVTRFDDDILVPIASDGFIVVRVSGDRPMVELLGRQVRPVAFTNPIWVAVLVN